MPIAQGAIIGQDATSTGVSPFFLTHGYHPNLGDSIQLLKAPATPRSPAQLVAAKLQQIKEYVKFTQSTIAYAQQRQQEIHDKHQDPAPAYQVGDKV